MAKKKPGWHKSKKSGPPDPRDPSVKKSKPTKPAPPMKPSKAPWDALMNDDDDEDLEEQTPEVEEVVKQCARIRETIEELGIHDNDFLTDVYEKVGDVCETIESRNHVTEKQKSALNNWEAAVEKFNRRR